MFPLFLWGGSRSISAPAGPLSVVIGAKRPLPGLSSVRTGSKGKPFPEPPETIKALMRARNRAAALGTACGSLGLFPCERQALIERGELLPVSWTHPIEDMSE